MATALLVLVSERRLPSGMGRGVPWAKMIYSPLEDFVD